jgi:uncharacterized Zn finger protein (UPF0148 family)
VPEKGKLKEEAKDLTVLANAQSHAWQDTVSGLEEAITEAQRIDSKRPLYRQAQKLIARWQMEIEAVAQLEKARGLAQGGTIADLTAAIAQAGQVAASNPRFDEAEREIQTWTGQIQTQQDRPILDQAEQIAMRGDINALQAAINQASQIGRGRSLHREAQNRIADWSSQIQRIQDQPILNRAREFAAVGNLPAAIETASQIRPGGLYEEAQAEIADWRKQIQAETDRGNAERYLQEAQQLANTGSIEALIAAIERADQVAASTSLRSTADDLINQWSWQLFQYAQQLANSDPQKAIAIAQRIPSGTEAYAQAQQQIKLWQQPAPPAPSPSP